MSSYFNEDGEPLMTASQARLEADLDDMAADEPSDPEDDDRRDSFYEDLYEQQQEGQCPACGETGCEVRLYSSRDAHTGKWHTYHDVLSYG